MPGQDPPKVPVVAGEQAKGDAIGWFEAVATNSFGEGAAASGAALSD